MVNFTSTPTERVPLVPNKRVSYAFGMVLGVDEFRQEQEHFEWKHTLGNLLLHGYGTVCGLQVQTAPLLGDVEIRVSSGYAVSPQGHWVWVDKDQCAPLGRWVLAHFDELQPPPPAASRDVFVKLCYDTCDVDLVPIAGQACVPGRYLPVG